MIAISEIDDIMKGFSRSNGNFELIFGVKVVKKTADFFFGLGFATDKDAKLFVQFQIQSISFLER